MENRRFGSTGLAVSPLGLGAGSLGDSTLDESAAGALLNGALDLGIRLIDTARSYGLAEERIGRHLAHRRDDYVLSTKVGYGVEDVPDWTGAAVTGGVERALRVMRTDRIDIVHLHSCPRDVLERGEVVRALEDAVRDGKVRVAGYSGDNEALQCAVDSGAFGSIQASFNVVDRAAAGAIGVAAARGMGVLAKRALANGPWRDTRRPGAPDRGAYWDRWQALGVIAGLEPAETCLRFAAFARGISACLAGSSRREHVEHLVRCVERGPLPEDVLRALNDAYARVGSDWPGVI